MQTRSWQIKDGCWHFNAYPDPRARSPEEPAPLRVRVDHERYAILEAPPQVEGRNALGCKLCGLVSYNAHDVANCYCGNCHEFLNPDSPIGRVSLVQAAAVAQSLGVDSVNIAGKQTPLRDIAAGLAPNRHVEKIGDRSFDFPITLNSLDELRALMRRVAVADAAAEPPEPEPEPEPYVRRAVTEYVHDANHVYDVHRCRALAALLNVESFPAGCEFWIDHGGPNRLPHVQVRGPIARVVSKDGEHVIVDPTDKDARGCDHFELDVSIDPDTLKQVLAAADELDGAERTREWAGDGPIEEQNRHMVSLLCHKYGQELPHVQYMHTGQFARDVAREMKGPVR